MTVITNPTIPAAPPADLALAFRCTLCWAPPQTSCQRSPAGCHLARYQDAERRGLLSRDALAEVVAGLVVIAPHVIVASPPRTVRVPAALAAVTARAWADDALCAETDPELFFPERGHVETVAAARAVCGHCLVRAECLDEAMSRRLWHDSSGIWGGTTPHERRAIARERSAA